MPLAPALASPLSEASVAAPLIVQPLLPADAYRLAPADGELTEAEFSKIPLDFVGDGILRYDGDHSTQLPFKATTVSNGTFPPGSQWRKNPISRSPTVRSLPPPRLLPRAAG